MEDERIPGVSRQQLKQLKAMPLPNFRRWLLEYTDIIYNQGISDCSDALHVEFGFGRIRLQRMIDHIMTGKAKIYVKDTEVPERERFTDKEEKL